MTKKIGFIDSGVGGLSVLNSLAHHLNATEIYYLADAAHLPYGEKSPAFLLERASSMTHFLQGRGVTTIYVACNTLSATILPLLRKKFSTILYIDLLVPTVEKAYQKSQNNHIGVMATPATIATGIHKQLLQAKNSDITVIEQACPDFVPLVEQGQPEPATQNAIQQYLRPFQNTGVDTIILGCTHYWFLEKKLKAVAPTIIFISAATVVKPATVIENNPLITMVTTGTLDYLKKARDTFCQHTNCCPIKLEPVEDF